MKTLTPFIGLRACLKCLLTRRVRARGLQVRAETTLSCRPGPLTGRVFKQALRAFCSLTAMLLTVICGNAATPDGAPARSVKNLKLSVSANGRYFVDQGGK